MTTANPTFEKSIAERDLERAALVSAAAEANPGPIWDEHDGSWSTTFNRMTQTMLETYNEPWSAKTRLTKILLVLQLPMHVAVYLSTAVMHNGDAQRTWDRNMYMLTSFFMLPMATLIMSNDAFYSHGAVAVPPIVIALAIGLVLAVAVRVFTRVAAPPKIQWWFSISGFLVALVWIYALSVRGARAARMHSCPLCPFTTYSWPALFYGISPIYVFLLFL